MTSIFNLGFYFFFPSKIFLMYGKNKISDPDVFVLPIIIPAILPADWYKKQKIKFQTGSP
jgi:hypothetical protein